MSNLAIQQRAPVGPQMVPPGLEVDYPVVRQLPLFEGVGNDDLIAALQQGGIAVRNTERDMFVLDPIGLSQGQAAPIYYIANGQVAAAVFMDNELAERKAWQQRREGASKEEREAESLLMPPPLARVALKNIALFMEGDLFNSGALQATHGQPIAFYTTAPSILVSIDQRWIAELAVRYPMFEQRLRRALSVSRERLAWVSGVKQELLDFFVRQGISVAGEMVRVRQLGLCIDCKLCEEACEERYGARRLTLGGYQIGMLDFIYTCRTCTDQRCIDPCAYDSIKYDQQTREVVINEATCTGCTACAQSCPYGAIDMVEIEAEAPAFKKHFMARLEKKGALQFGVGTPRVARARRIANKCDHCMAYGDQACVSACPTGSLIEIDAYDLFRERTPKMAALARTGFDHDLQSRDRREVLPVMPFTEGLAVRSGGIAKLKRGRYAPLVMWLAGFAVFGVTLFEVLLRSGTFGDKGKKHTFLEWFGNTWDMLIEKAEFAGVADEKILENVKFVPGDNLSLWCGLVGTAFMIVAAIYPIFRRMSVFRWLASNTMWFDFHIMAGTIGPLFIGLHTALKLGDIHMGNLHTAAAFWCMVIVVISGFLGRYLYTQVPELSSGVELEELDHERAFQRARPLLPVPMAEIDRELGEQRAKAQNVAMSTSVLRAMWWLLFQDIGRIPRTLARRGRLKALGVDSPTRNDLARRAARMIVIARRHVVAPKAQLLLHSWKKVHVPFTIFLTVFAVIHIFISWSRAEW